MEYKGELKGFPQEVVNWMLDEQEKQGNKRDVTVFEKARISFLGAIDWDRTEFGWEFCNEVIHRRNFDLFFRKFPKKQEEKPKEKLGQEPAFPNECARWLSKEEELVISGMSKRFYAACAAMQGLSSNSYWAKTNANGVAVEALINKSYEIADELLKQENL